MNTSSLSMQLAEHMRVHYNTLFDYGLKLTNHDEDLVKDCIQDVFIGFWNHRAEWVQIQSVRAYLLVALRNRITDAQRAGKRFIPLLTFPDAEDPATVVAFSLPDEPAKDGSAPAHHLKLAFDQLPRRQREAVFLRYYSELDYPEIARVMGIKERTVYNLVHEGLQHLRQHLTSVRWLMLAALGAAILFFLKIF